MPKSFEKEKRIQEDEFYMRKVFELAKKGIGHVNPNPLVGALIVQNGKITGKGFHQKYGEAHAEINALNNVSMPIKDATLYVNLEPCAHQGKTPSCAKEIIKHNFKRVVFANIDPNPLVAGKGIQILENSGIEVKTGILEKEGKELNKIFLKYIKQKIPYVMLKSAMSLDGKIATHTGESKWISCKASREIVHKYRHQHSAVLTGVNSIIADDSMLNTRLDTDQPSHPIRVIIDPKGRIPLNSKVLNSPDFGKVIIATTHFANKDHFIKVQKKEAEIIICPLNPEHKIDLNFLIRELGKKGIDSIMVEAGGNTNFECIQQNIVDEIKLFVSPQIIGGQNSISAFEGLGFDHLKDSRKFKNIKYQTVDTDLLIEAEL